MSRKTSVALAALLSVAIAGPAIARPQCYTNQDVQAMQVRQLHYELMVAALKCQGGEVDFHGKWAKWVERFGSTMSDNANHLRGLFSRLGKGQSGMDRYVTQVSNDASMRAQYVEDYCDTQAKLFDTVLMLSPVEMQNWATQTIEKPMPASASCTAQPSKPAVKQAKAETETKAKATQPAHKPKAEKTKADAKAKAAPRTQEKG